MQHRNVRSLRSERAGGREERREGGRNKEREKEREMRGRAAKVRRQLLELPSKAFTYGSRCERDVATVAHLEV